MTSAWVNDDAGAIAILERARADYPEIWELISLESELLRRTQGPLPALRLIENYTRQNWWHHAAWLAEGRLYAENNDVGQATRALRYAVLLDVHDVQALNLLAAISVRQNQLEQACATQRRAIAREPNQPRQYLMLAEILDKMGRTSEAQTARDDATRLKAIVTSPRIAAIKLNLASGAASATLVRRCRCEFIATNRSDSSHCAAKFAA